MLRLGLSPLNSHKFNYNFQNSHEFCAVCECTETTEHYLLSCLSYRLSRATMLNAISPIINTNVSTLPRTRLVSILLYGKEDISFESNTLILKEVVKYIKKSKRLDSI